MPSLKSENVFGKSFAKVTGITINKEFPNGFNYPSHHRFLSQNNAEYSKLNFRRIRAGQDPDPAEVRDASDTQNFSDAE